MSSREFAASDRWPQTIVLDFDYTIADSSPGVIECANYALTTLGLPAASDDAICRTIGLSLHDTFAQLAEEENRGHGDEFLRLFIERADEVMEDSTTLYEFVPNVMDALRAHGIGLGIVSQKYRRRIEGILERDGMADRFGAIVGAEDLTDLKPDPTGLLAAIDALGGSPAASLYVGDSVTDAETAKRGGVPFAAVLTGATPPGDFDGYPTFTMMKSISELPGLVNAWRGVC